MPTFGTTIWSGGLRFYDAGHTVSYNYVAGIGGGPYQGPLQIDSGDAEGTSTSLANHWRVVNALVEGNVIVGCPEGIRIGDNYSLAPSGIAVQNNVIANATTGTAITTVRAPVSSTVANNIYSNTPAGAGLVQDSDGIWRKTATPVATWLSGVSIDAVSTIGAWRGRPVEVVATWSDSTANDQVNLWTVAPGGEFANWAPPLDLAIGAIYTDAGESWSAAATGAYDARWIQTLRNLASWRGARTTYLRFAHEMNGNWFPWSVTAGTTAAFKTAWQRFRGLQLQYAPNAKLVFSPNVESSAVGWPSMWPGDSYVDVLGVDMYNQFQAQVNSPTDWTNKLNLSATVGGVSEPRGLGAYRQYAQDHGKPISIPEWGGNAESEASGGDNAAFITGVLNYVAANAGTTAGKFVYEVYFNAVSIQSGKFGLYPTATMTSGPAEYQLFFQTHPAGVTALGYGPRLSFLHVGDVGILGDVNETDGTGSLPTVGGQTVTVSGIPSSAVLGFPTISGGEPATPPGSIPTVLGGLYCLLGTAQLGYTTVGTPPDPDPSAAQTVSGVGNIFSAQVLGVPALSTADGAATLTAVGVSTAELFGRIAVGVGIPPTPAPGGVLVPALFAVGADGTTLTPLPGWSKISVSPMRNSPGSVTVDYPAGADGFTALHDGVSANPLHAQEIRIWLGGNATGALGGWLVAKAGDDLTPGSMWTFSGHFHEWLIKTAIVAPQEKSAANEKGELRFAGATAGLILSTVMLQAQSRGALPLVTRDFTSTVDSNGMPWANTVSSFNLSPGTTVAQVADKLVELGMCEYEVTAARVWRVYNLGTRGDDTTTTSDPLTFQAAANLAQHSRRESAEDAATAVLATGGEGFYQWATSPTGQAELGWRAEAGYSAGQISSEAGVQAAADTHLEAVRHGVAEYDAAIEFVLGNPLPLIDYGIGDWAWVTAGTTRRKLRIAQLGVTFQPGQAPSGTVALNDLIADKLSALYRRLNALQTGDAVVGTSTPTPGGAGEDINPPAAPAGVTVASTFAYQVAGQQTVTLAEVEVGWAAVTTNAYADDITAGKAGFAPLAAARLRTEGVGTDWTTTLGADVRSVYEPLLIAEWKVDNTNPSGSTLVSPEMLAWLDAYPAEHQGGGAVTDDVDHYRVQFQYLGAQQVTTPGPRGEDPPDQLQPEGAWEEPTNSPTTATALVFGNVEGGLAVGVRVAAVDRVGNQGPWSVVVAVDSATDNQPPPSPSTPITSVWFETMDITWDGKGSAGEDMRQAAPDLAGVEVHVAQGIAFLPDRPVTAGKVDLASSLTYVATLYGAGTWNVTDLKIGITYFARLVAVDGSGNASPPSATSAGVLPEQLVHIDIGPNAIGREQIIDLEVVGAKIANLAVNDAKISDLQVGKLTAGTMTANVVLGGRFSTPPSNNNHIEMDATGIRLYQGNSVVGYWQVFDASMLMTGTYLSGLSGQRINIRPNGTMIFYPTAGVNFGFLENLDGDIRMSGQVNVDQRAGYLLIDETRAAMTYSQVSTYNNPRTRFQVDPVAAASWAPIVSNRIDRRIDVGGLGPRWLYTNFDAAGDIGPSIVHLQQVSAAGNHAVLYGANSDAGIVLDAGTVVAVHNNITPAPINAAAFNVTSSMVAKRDIAPVQFRSGGATAVIRAAPARTFYYRAESTPRPDTPGTLLRRFDDDGRDTDPTPGEWTGPQLPPVMRVGPMADDLIKVAPEIVAPGLARDGGFVLNVATIAGMAWAGVGELADEHDVLAADVAKLREQVDRLAGRIVDGDVVEGD